MFPDDHQDKFDRLRRHFMSGLPQREAEIEDYTATLLEHGPDRPALEGLHLSAHKLAGICATYGLHRLGQFAEKAEALLERSQSQAPCEAEMEDILVATDRLTEELSSVIEAS